MTYVALLRGINVGGKSLIQMAKLKLTFERLGFNGVTTFIASGNIIFQAAATDRTKLTQRIEIAIEKDFKLKVKVLIKDLKEMAQLVKSTPSSWVNDQETKCDVMFLWKEADVPDILKQLPFNSKIEDVKYVPGAIIWRVDREKASKSRMLRIAGTELYKQMTIRNPNTVRKIYALMQEAEKSAR